MYSARIFLPVGCGQEVDFLFLPPFFPCLAKSGLFLKALIEDSEEEEEEEKRRCNFLFR